MEQSRKKTDCHWLTPIKSNTKYDIIEELGEGDYIVEMAVSAHARKQDPSLPERWKARLVLYPESNQPNHIKGLLSSLVEFEIYPAEQIRDVYFERWEIECGYGGIKHQMLEDNVLLAAYQRLVSIKKYGVS